MLNFRAPEQAELNESQRLANLYTDALEKARNEQEEARYFDLQGQMLLRYKAAGANKGTLVSLDVQDLDIFDQFKEQLKGCLPEGPKNNLETNFDRLIKENERVSIIPIHTEMLYHTLRVANALTENKEQADAAFQAAYHHLYQRINHDLAVFLNKKPEISIQQLNQFIAKNRENWMVVAETLTISHLILNNAELRSEKNRNKWLKLHSAADMNVLSSNKITGTITHISGTKNSPHSKK